MVITPFHYVPKRLFLTRMAAPALGVFLLGLFILEGVVRSPALRPKEVRATSGANELLRHVRFDLRHPPEACVSGEQLSAFQSRQCEQYWDRLIMEGFLAALPLLLAGFYLLLFFDSLTLLYKKTRRKIENKQIAFGGKVTKPAEAPNDVFGWVYCLRTISVELKGGKQIKVYIPLDMPIPHPNQTLAIYDLGKFFGSKRYMAVVYAPHVAVISGLKVS